MPSHQRNASSQSYVIELGPTAVRKRGGSVQHQAALGAIQRGENEAPGLPLSHSTSRASSVTLTRLPVLELDDDDNGECGNCDGSRMQGEVVMGNNSKMTPAMRLESTPKAKYVPPKALLGSIIAVLILTAGAASLMTGWLHAHKMPIESPGVLYVNEGTEVEREREYRDETLGPHGHLRFDEQVSHPTTLTISSVTSTLLGYSLEPIMALIAYRLASDWLRLQRRIFLQQQQQQQQSKEISSTAAAAREDLPTPLQYALLAQLTSKVSLDAIVNALRHLFLAHGSRAKVPTMLRRALAWSVVLFALNVSIANLDILLHETTRAVSVADVSTDISSLPYGDTLNQTLCQGAPSDEGSTTLPCLYDESTHLFASTPSTVDFGTEGYLTAANASQLHLVQTWYAKEHDLHEEPSSLVYLTNPSVRRFEYAAALQLMGVSSHCKVITPQCNATPNAFDCSSIGLPQLQSNDLQSMASNMTILDHADASHSHLGVQLVFPAIQGVQSNAVEDTGFQTIGAAANASGNTTTSQAYVLAQCSIEYLDVDMSYFNNSYTVERRTPAPAAVLLSGPLLTGEVTDLATAALGKFAGRVSFDDFAASLGHTVAYHSLALVGGLFEPQLVDVRSWRRILAQQYNFYLLAVFIGLLYAYAIAAIVIFFWAWSVSSDIVSYCHHSEAESQSMSEGKEKSTKTEEVPAALLAQRRLVDPITYLVQDHLSGFSLLNSNPTIIHQQQHHHQIHHQQAPSLLSNAPHQSLYENQKAERSTASLAVALRTARKEVLHVFDEPHDQERVVVAVHDDAHRGFGVWPASSVTSHRHAI